VIGLYPEAGWETVTALFLPETTDSLFLRLRPSDGNSEVIETASRAYRRNGKWVTCSIAGYEALFRSISENLCDTVAAMWCLFDQSEKAFSYNKRTMDRAMGPFSPF
jgi:hypothetical protein